jgi:hypothetical protein
LSVSHGDWPRDGSRRNRFALNFFTRLTSDRLDPLATIFGQETYQTVHLFDLGCIEHVPTFLARCHEVGVRELFQMERQRCTGKFKLFLNETHIEALWARRNEQSKDSKPRWLGERGEGSNRVFFVHGLFMIGFNR